MKKVFNSRNKLNFHKGDEVVVISGKYKGEKSVISRILCKKNLAIVKGINKTKKAVKVGQNNSENFLIFERPIYLSKVRVLKKAKKVVAKSSKKEVKG